MNISSVTSTKFSIFKSAIRATVTAVVLGLPIKTGCDTFIRNINNELPKVEVSATVSSVLDKILAEGLATETLTNIRGGVTHTFSNSELQKLRKLLINSKIKKTYTFPVDSSIKPYIPSTGQFGSVRPQGRAHLGVDIYPKLYGRKPQKPVSVLSATDGVVVSVKKSPKHDPENLIANNIKIMAPDGKIYSYDHLGRPEDYPTAKFYPLKELGEIVHVGDTLGTVGKTGETEVWHLHLAVEDLDVQKAQLKSPIWKKLYKQYSVYSTPRGQVDPLNEKKSGEISKYLNKYKIDKGEKVDYVDDL